MGKVGSSTIYNSICSAGVIAYPEKQIGSTDEGFRIVKTHMHNIVQEYLSEAPQQRIVILTMVRDMLRRTVSAFFQNVDNMDNMWWYIGKRQRIMDLSAKELVDAFRNRQYAHYRGRVEPWFDRFEESTGIPLFEHHFPKKEGRSWIKKNNIEVGIIRTENLTGSADWIAERIGIPTISYQDSNIGVEKWYSEKYKEFLREFRPTEYELEMYYGSKIMRHFYSTEEIDRMIAKWPRERQATLHSSQR